METLYRLSYIGVTINRVVLAPDSFNNVPYMVPEIKSPRFAFRPSSSTFIDMEIRENVPLAPLTTFEVGGPARWFAAVSSVEEFSEAVAAKKGEPLFILGKGSNLVVSDEGFPGLVVANRLMKFEIEERARDVLVTAGSGEDWDAFVERCVAAGLAGPEALSGIPGSVGAAAVQNIGAYGVSADGLIQEVRGVNIRTGKDVVFAGNECGFGYRESMFKRDKDVFITEVVFRLHRRDRAAVPTYHDLERYFEGRREPVTPAELREAVIEIRSRKGMVIRPEYESFRSAGSFFKNPVVSRTAFLQVKAVVDAEPEGSGCRDIWHWEQKDRGMKLAAACLMERAGFSKGYARGPAGISKKHSLALVNLGGDARAADIIALAREVKQGVFDKFGVFLEPEAEFVGFPADPLA